MDGCSIRCAEARVNPHRVSRELLWWHLRQAVLGNVRGGGGEPIPEHDFSRGGGGMIGVISVEKYRKERLEMEVAARLRGFV